MESLIHFDRELRKRIEKNARANSNMCWTCQSCVTECPVNIATGRLNPMKLVRMANLGLFNDLLNDPSLWYCQSCNRCNQICPMIVKPADVISFARKEMIRKKLISLESYTHLGELYRRFQRVRWHAIKSELEKKDFSMSKFLWEKLLNTPVKRVSNEILIDSSFQYDISLKKVIDLTNTSSCLNCGGCSGPCPVFYERTVFEPQWVFRMVNFGFLEELLRSPSIWLCVGCMRCTNICSQKVSGHSIINYLQSLTIEKGVVPTNFSIKLEALNKMIYPYLLEEIDLLLGYHESEKLIANNMAV